VYDYVIVGGGIAGLSCAYYLTRKGFKIALIEKNKSFQNASYASAGLLSPIKFHTYSLTLQQLCVEAIKFWPNFLDEIDGKFLIQSKGELILSYEKEELKQIQDAFLKFDLPVSFLTNEELKTRFPYLSKSVTFGLFADDVYSINNNILLDKLLAIVSSSTDVFFSTVVYDVNQKGGSLSSVVTSSGVIEGKNFIFATGAEKAPFITELFEVEVEGVKGVVLELLGAHNIVVPVIYKHYYIVPRRKNILLAGTVVKEKDYFPYVKIDEIEEIITNIKYFYPDIKNFSILDFRCGQRPFIKDRTVIYQKSTKVSNAYIIGGLFRNGILLAPYLAYQLVNKYC